MLKIYYLVTLGVGFPASCLWTLEASLCFIGNTVSASRSATLGCWCFGVGNRAVGVETIDVGFPPFFRFALFTSIHISLSNDDLRLSLHLARDPLCAVFQ
jgi:hypothetical protein